MKTQVIAPATLYPEVGMLAGWSIRASAAAVVRIREFNVTGKILASVGIPIGESSDIALPRSIKVPTGVFVQVVSGTVEGVLWYD